MAIQIKNTKEVKSEWIKIAVYGGAGIGKTRLCATAPKPLIVSAESGLLSLRNDDVDFVEIKTMKDLDDVYKYAKSPECIHETICLDSASEIAETVFEEFAKNEKDNRQAYLKMGDAMIHSIRNFRDLPGKHVVFNFKMKMVEDEATDSILYVPMAPGKMIGHQVPYMFDELFCMQIKKDGTRFLQTVADRQRFCKDRSGSLEKEEPANLTQLINKIRGT